MEGASLPPRGRSPRRAPAGSPAHSRHSSPNWSDVSDHSPPRVLGVPLLRPGPEASPAPQALPLQRPGGRRSPQGGGAAPRPPRRRKKPFFRHTGLSEETASARLEVACLVLQVMVATAALMQCVPLALVTSAWQHEGPHVCPLLVKVPPGFGRYWGNRDLAPCKTAAFLPLMVAALALTLAAAHACVLHVWRAAGRAPAASASRVYAGITLALVALEAAVALTAVLVLTEGFRQTCISFDLSLSWNETPRSCRRNLDDRDASYDLGGTTFPRLVTGLVGGWACVVLTATLTVVCAVRARLCRCHLLCV